MHICVTISAVHILSNFLAGDIHKFFSDYIIPCVYTFMQSCLERYLIQRVGFLERKKNTYLHQANNRIDINIFNLLEFFKINELTALYV